LVGPSPVRWELDRKGLRLTVSDFIACSALVPVKAYGEHVGNLCWLYVEVLDYAAARVLSALYAAGFRPEAGEEGAWAAWERGDVSPDALGLRPGEPLVPGRDFPDPN